ncbi:MAG: conserved membrane protein of unknown function [Candidatus Thorarchaeota archaeon]|nr:MAG: conserved membrane protein of unknown function [Candidatus Thorarchaeota archaeon]
MAAEQYLIVGVLIVGAALAKVAEKYRLPYPIPLIIAGIVLGQALPNEGIPEALGLEFIAQLTLATVLFYAGLTMNLKELRLSLPVVALLASVGVLLTSIIAGGAIYLAFSGIGLTAFLIGAILSPTDPAALFSVLESGGVRVKRKIYSILEGEAVFNDATSVILVITVFEPLIAVNLIGDPSLAQPWFIILAQFIGSLIFGVIIAFVIARIIGDAILRAGDQTNITILTATTPILAYGVGEMLTFLGFHPGAMAAVFTGIFMANAKSVNLDVLPQQSMRNTTKNVSFAFEIVVFILMGYTLNLEFVTGVFVGTQVPVLLVGAVVAFLVIFVARPVSVFLITASDRTMDWKDRFFISWAGVKGVASAALAAIAVSVLVHSIPEGTPQLIVDQVHIAADTITGIVFIVLMISLVVQGVTAPIFAKRLGLEEEMDVFDELSARRNATRHALLRLVDEYTEGKIDPEIYRRLKSELEEEIYQLEDELRKMVQEKRARLLEIAMREEICKSKLSYYEEEYEKGKIPEVVYDDRKDEIEAEINELSVMRRHCAEGKTEPQD